MIECTVIASILSDVDHPLIAAIQSGVEDAPLFRYASFNLDLAEHFIPAIASAALDGFEVPIWNFFVQVFLRLLNADEGNAIAEFQNLLVWRRNDQEFPVLGVPGIC